MTTTVLADTQVLRDLAAGLNKEGKVNGGSGFADVARRVAKSHPDIADYHVLAQSMLAEIKGQEYDLLEKLLPGYIRAVLSRKGPADSDEAVWESFLGERIATKDRGTVFVRDATPEEVEAGAERRRRFAGNLDKRAAAFDAVAAKARAAGNVVIGDLADGVQTLRDLEATLALETTRRARAERRARTLNSLRACRDLLLQWRDAGESPSLLSLRARRAELQDRLATARASLAGLLATREASERIFHGTR